MSAIVTLIPDLIFRTRVESTARALGIAVSAASSAYELTELVTEATHLILIDLSIPQDEAMSAIRQVRGLGPTPPRLVAFASHVDTGAIRAANEAGADQVLPRSSFAQQLPDILKSAAI